MHRTRRHGKPYDPDDSGIPPLSRWERFGAGVVALGGACVGGLGFYASFDGVSTAAASWGFTDPWVLPTAIDSAIPVFTGAYLLLIRMGMPLWWARLVPWALSLITCALNVAVGNSLWSKIAHGAMSLLWVAVSEIAAHIYAVRIGAATGRRRQMDKIRWARWIYSPLPTFLLHRRMKLWEITDYGTMLELEQERIAYEAQLRSRFGRGWRRKAPVESLLPLRLARTGIPLRETAAEGLRAAGAQPMSIFASPPAAPVEESKALPSPTAAVPAEAMRKPRAVTATVPPQAPQEQECEATSRPETTAPAQDQSSAVMPPLEVPAWRNEDELYDIIKWVLDNGYRELFSGPLTGAEIASVLEQSEGNGRKVRARLIKTYAAERGIDLPPRATVDQVFAAFGHATPVSA